MDIKDLYRAMQEHCGIEVGDKVRPVRKFEPDEMGSNQCGWDCDGEKMEMVNKRLPFVVSRICSHSIKSKKHSYPFFALELVEKAKKEEMIEVDGKEYSTSTIKKALQEYVK